MTTALFKLAHGKGIYSDPLFPLDATSSLSRFEREYLRGVLDLDVTFARNEWASLLLGFLGIPGTLLAGSLAHLRCLGMPTPSLLPAALSDPNWHPFREAFVAAVTRYAVDTISLTSSGPCTAASRPFRHRDGHTIWPFSLTPLTLMVTSTSDGTTLAIYKGKTTLEKLWKSQWLPPESSTGSRLVKRPSYKSFFTLAAISPSTSPSASLPT